MVFQTFKEDFEEGFLGFSKLEVVYSHSFWHFGKFQFLQHSKTQWDEVSAQWDIRIGYHGQIEFRLKKNSHVMKWEQK